MAKFLSEKQAKDISDLRRKIRNTNTDDWLCEGVDNNELSFFNNNTNEYFNTDYKGNIISNPENVNITNNLKTRIQLEGKIMQICYS